MTCPRCHGLVISQYEDTRCLICGWYQHPEPVPLKEYPNRGGSGYRTTACPRGHTYTPETTYYYTWEGDGRTQRRCLLCCRMKAKQRKAVKA
jgi:hypothetical protein